MLRTIHVGVDGSAASQAAIALALRWAGSATLIGHAPVAEPFITEAEAMPMGGAYFTGHRDEDLLAKAKARAQAALDNFSRQCASVPHTTVLDVGASATLLHQRAECADLTIIGHETFFHFDGSADADLVLGEVIHHPPRPIVVVPEAVTPSQTVIVAYDGSPESARALFAFNSCGLAAHHTVIVVTVRETADEAKAISQRAVDYLSSHGITASARPLATTRAAGEVIREEITAAGAGLLVMGAFSHSTLHQFFFGSTTKTVLGQVAVPVFLFH